MRSDFTGRNATLSELRAIAGTLPPNLVHIAGTAGHRRSARARPDLWSISVVDRRRLRIESITCDAKPVRAAARLGPRTVLTRRALRVRRIRNASAPPRHGNASRHSVPRLVPRRHASPRQCWSNTVSPRCIPARRSHGPRRGDPRGLVQLSLSLMGAGRDSIRRRVVSECEQLIAGHEPSRQGTQYTYTIRLDLSRLSAVVAHRGCDSLYHLSRRQPVGLGACRVP